MHSIGAAYCDICLCVGHIDVLCKNGWNRSRCRLGADSWCGYRESRITVTSRIPGQIQDMYTIRCRCSMQSFILATRSGTSSNSGTYPQCENTFRWKSRSDQSIRSHEGWQVDDAAFCQITLETSSV